MCVLCGVLVVCGTHTQSNTHPHRHTRTECSRRKMVFVDWMDNGGGKWQDSEWVSEWASEGVSAPVVARQAYDINKFRSIISSLFCFFLLFLLFSVHCVAAQSVVIHFNELNIFGFFVLVHIHIPTWCECRSIWSKYGAHRTSKFDILWSRSFCTQKCGVHKLNASSGNANQSNGVSNPIREKPKRHFTHTEFYPISYRCRRACVCVYRANQHNTILWARVAKETKRIRFVGAYDDHHCRFVSNKTERITKEVLASGQCNDKIDLIYNDISCGAEENASNGESNEKEEKKKHRVELNWVSKKYDYNCAAQPSIKKFEFSIICIIKIDLDICMQKQKNGRPTQPYMLGVINGCAIGAQLFHLFTIQRTQSHHIAYHKFTHFSHIHRTHA